LKADAIEGCNALYLIDGRMTVLDSEVRERLECEQTLRLECEQTLRREIQSIRADVDSDRAKRNDLAKTNSLLIAQTRKDLEKAIRQRALSHDQVVSICREAQEPLQRQMHERVIAEKACSESVAEEKRLRMVQFSRIEGALATLKRGTEDEFKRVEESLDTRLSDRRQSNNDVVGPWKGISAALKLEQTHRESLETELKLEQTHRESLEIEFRSEVVGWREHLKLLLSLEKRVDDLAAHQNIETIERPKGDDEVMRLASEARQVIEKEIRTRTLLESQMRQQQADLSTTLSHQQVVFSEQQKRRFDDFTTGMVDLASTWQQQINELLPLKDQVADLHKDQVTVEERIKELPERFSNDLATKFRQLNLFLRQQST